MIVTEKEKKMKPSPKHLDGYSCHCCLQTSLTSTHHELAWRLLSRAYYMGEFIKHCRNWKLQHLKIKAFPKDMPGSPRIQLLEKELRRYCSAHLAKQCDLLSSHGYLFVLAFFQGFNFTWEGLYMKLHFWVVKILIHAHFQEKNLTHNWKGITEKA